MMKRVTQDSEGRRGVWDPVGLLEIAAVLTVALCLALVAVMAHSLFQSNPQVISRKAMASILLRDVTKANREHETQIVGHFIGSAPNHQAGAWRVYLQIRRCTGRSLMMPTSFILRKKADQAHRFSAILSRFDQMECVDSTRMEPVERNDGLVQNMPAGWMPFGRTA